MLQLTPQQDDWLSLLHSEVHYTGCAVVHDVFDTAMLERTREAMYRVQRAIHQEVGLARLEAAGELGVLRLMLRFDPIFASFLSNPSMLAMVDALLSPTAILHLQNGFILPTHPPGATPSVFQNRFHRDFPRVLGGFLASINLFVAVDEFTEVRGATWVVPGTHQQVTPPPNEYLERAAVCVTCPPGSVLVFDSTLWHRAGHNTSGMDRLAINHQFTRSYFKQQVDYVRALGDAAVLAQPSRTQQLLGWYTRVVTSLDEYYQPQDKRLYRSGQD